MLKKVDKILLLLMVIYSLVGLVMIFSASSITAVLFHDVPEYYFFLRQTIFIIISWIFGFFVLTQPLTRYKLWGPIGMIGIIGILLLIIPYGAMTNQAQRWFDLGIFSFQPSEFAQSILIVYLAMYYDKLIRKNDVSPGKLMVPLYFVGVAAAFTFLQPDFGTAAIIGGIAFFIFQSLPINDKKTKMIKGLGWIAAVVAVILVISAPTFLGEYQRSRLTFTEPCTRYTERTGYQVCNGFIAMSNGGLFGVGLGKSNQKYLYLPEAHTDFIFPIIVEELGVVVGIILILGFLAIMLRVLIIARKASAVKGSIIAYGTFIYLLLHLLVNFMGVLALIPLTGVPVPFLSYGGSFYINLIFLLFLTQRVKIESEEAKIKAVLRG